MTVEKSLQQAQELILGHCTETAGEIVSLADALHRFPLAPLSNRAPKPAFSQSTRDGYALGDPGDQNGADPQVLSYTIIGDIAAGDTVLPPLGPGQAVRITTGAMVPPNTRCVIPFEICREQNQRVHINRQDNRVDDSFIRKRGSDLPAGRILVPAGKPITVDHLPLLAGDGYDRVKVHERPKVSVLCTGSELIDAGQGKPHRGQKISGNIFFLEGLISQAGGKCCKLGTVGDDISSICAILQRRQAASPHIIITTGGMGPGKYDLMEQVFHDLGGKVLYSRLRVRPGKATLFGTLGSILFFALPGPPPAVRLLFQELIEPALFRMQGADSPLPRTLRARLTVALPRRGRSAALILKGGVLDEDRGCLTVRAAEKLEPIDCIITLPPHCRFPQPDDAITIHCPRFRRVF